MSSRGQAHCSCSDIVQTRQSLFYSHYISESFTEFTFLYLPKRLQRVLTVLLLWKINLNVICIRTQKATNTKEKSIGPKMELWGTPHDSGAADEEYSPRWTEKLLLDKYDWNHFRAVPLIPPYCSRHDRRIVWSTVSKATDDTTHVLQAINLLVILKVNYIKYGLEWECRKTFFFDML